MIKLMNPLLLPSNAAMIGSSVEKLKASQAGKTDEERRAYIQKCYADGNEADYAAIRKENFNISVLPELSSAEIFELKSLPDDGRIMLKSTRNSEYSVRTIDHHANAPRNIWLFRDSLEMHDVYKLSTDTVEYPRRSLIDGDLNAVNEVNRDVDFAYRNEIDLDVWTLWLTIFTTFPAGTYALHSRVNSGNMPLTNVINSSGDGAITVSVMKQLLEHVSLLGLEVRTIYLSPQDLSGIWDWTPVAIASGNVADVIPTGEHQSIFSSGKILSMFGYNINWKTLNTLATGTMYVTTNKPSGSLYYKPGFERSKFVSSEIMEHVYDKPDYEALGMEGAIKPLITAPERMNSVKVQFA